jgi:hypothetical protein
LGTERAGQSTNANREASQLNTYDLGLVDNLKSRKEYAVSSEWRDILDLIMKELYPISSGIIFLVLILAFISALSSPIVFASMAQQEKSVSNESNPAKIIIDKNYNEKNNFASITGYSESEGKFSGESSATLQTESSWIDMGLPEGPYKSSGPLPANSNSQRSELTTVKQGFIGLYHPFKGKVYAGTGINDDEDLYQAYSFGVNGIINDPSYGEYLFKENIEKHCQEFDTNLVYGIIRPPSERGVVNNPNDTALWEPASPSGMIQAAARFSRLSTIFP